MTDFSSGSHTIWWISSKSSEDHQDVADVQLSHDLVGLLLRGRHRLHTSHTIKYTGSRLQPDINTKQDQCRRCHVHLADSRDVRVVPGVVVDQNRPVCHGGYLVAVIPPGHDLSILNEGEKVAFRNRKQKPEQYFSSGPDYCMEGNHCTTGESRV